jgi:hypothetical protein
MQDSEVVQIVTALVAAPVLGVFGTYCLFWPGKIRARAVRGTERIKGLPLLRGYIMSTVYLWQTRFIGLISYAFAGVALVVVFRLWSR